MQSQQSVIKAMMPVFIFIIGVFLVSGLSYITTVFAYPPQNNAFKPINTSDQTQGRCKAVNTQNEIRPSYMYVDCDAGQPLYTNGLVITGKKTTFLISGDPKATDSRYRSGALYVGCSTDSQKYSDAIRKGCSNGGVGVDSAPEAYFNGDIYLHELADPSAPPERELCLSTTGEVVAGKPLCSEL